MGDGSSPGAVPPTPPNPLALSWNGGGGTMAARRGAPSFFTNYASAEIWAPRFAYDPEVTLPSAPPPIRPCYYTNMTANRCLGLRRSGLPTDIVPVADYLSSYE